MTYWFLNSFFLVPAVLLGLAAVVQSRRKAEKAQTAGATRTAGGTRTAPGSSLLKQRAAAVAGTAGLLVLLTAIFDNVMIAAGLFSYDDRHVSGVFIGLAPVEDFAYPLAAVILLPSLWALLGRDGPARNRP